MDFFSSPHAFPAGGTRLPLLLRISAAAQKLQILYILTWARKAQSALNEVRLKQPSPVANKKVMVKNQIFRVPC
ncbi:hypothetical protein D7Z54_32465 [Salibacterium salarium]|uniref:Uncharacterized protein n=1 Tax=Salibacterium salarium TaxID=284579 RepID=A0A428MSU8_9BACI|nr:hypothetical protein D7Z54_32465 [Salibacterium salarium]